MITQEQIDAAWDAQGGGSAYEAFANGFRAGARLEREAIMDEWHMCVQSDLENGVKWMNERAAEVWAMTYPQMAGFAAAIEKRGVTEEGAKT